MKKVAVASEGNFVSGHFGHCEGFKVFNLEDNNVIGTDFIQNPGHKPGFLPPFLAEKGINVIIAGGMGATAQELFNNNGVDVVVGAQGNIDDVINKYVSGILVSSGNTCDEHKHEDHCNG